MVQLIVFILSGLDNTLPPQKKHEADPKEILGGLFVLL